MPLHLLQRPLELILRLRLRKSKLLLRGTYRSLFYLNKRLEKILGPIHSNVFGTLSEKQLDKQKVEALMFTFQERPKTAGISVSE